MRDLTPEELALAPDWATHYETNFPAWHFIEVCFFNNKKAVNLFKSGEIGIPYPNEVGIEDTDRLIINPEPFDITQHEWSDTSIENISYDEFCICLESPEYQNSINRNDAIAIAKHFNLTAEDFK